MSGRNIIRVVFALLIFLGLALTLNWCGLGHTERVEIIEKPDSQ